MKSLKFGALLTAALGAAAVMASGSAANAATTTLFSDIGPGQSYAVQEYSIHSPLDTPKASSFVAAASGSVSEIDIALQTVSGDSATVSLWTGGGGAPGVELGAWTASGFPTIGSVFSGHLATITGISGINLTAGDAYFLEVAAIGPSYTAWMLNSQGVTGGVLIDGSVFSNWTTGAFDVLGAAGVPEPATWALMVLGLGLIGAALRRRGAAAFA